jgi:hypothetical protein
MSTNVSSETTAFSAMQYEEAYPPGVERSFWHVARNATIAAQLVQSGMDGGPLLEIGCGRGIVVDYLRQRGMDCIGCDLASPTVEPRLAASVLPATDFRSLPESRRAAIEGVLLCDVLEHLEKPRDLLRAIVVSLPRLKQVLITVPARKELWSQWDVHFGHFRRYDLRGVAEEMAGGGLVVSVARYFFHALYAPMLASRGRRRDTTIAAPNAPTLHRWLGTAFVLEGRVVPAWVPGTSIIAVARVTGRPA